MFLDLFILVLNVLGTQYLPTLAYKCANCIPEIATLVKEVELECLFYLLKESKPIKWPRRFGELLCVPQAHVQNTYSFISVMQMESSSLHFHMHYNLPTVNSVHISH